MASKMYSRDYNVLPSQSGGNPALMSLLPVLAQIAIDRVIPALGSVFKGKGQGSGLVLAGQSSGRGRTRKSMHGNGKIGQWFKDTF